jgi:cytochrome c oxidase cbb3-type subunit 4
MDVNSVRAVFTLLALLSFLGVIFWAYSSKNKERFEEDAMLPFADEEVEPPPAGESLR